MNRAEWRKSWRAVRSVCGEDYIVPDRRSDGVFSLLAMRCLDARRAGDRLIRRKSIRDYLVSHSLVRDEIRGRVWRKQRRGRPMFMVGVDYANGPDRRSDGNIARGRGWFVPL